MLLHLKSLECKYEIKLLSFIFSIVLNYYNLFHFKYESKLPSFTFFCCV